MAQGSTDSKIASKVNEPIKERSVKNDGGTDLVAKNQESVKSGNVTVIASKKNDVDKPTMHQKSFNSLKPIVGMGLVEVEIDDVKFYMEHSDEYAVKKGERLIPYIIRMNERYKTKVETRIQNRKIKRGATIFFVVFGSILAIIAIIFVYSKLMRSE